MASLFAIILLYGDRGSNQKLKKEGFMITIVVIRSCFDHKKWELKNLLFCLEALYVYKALLCKTLSTLPSCCKCLQAAARLA